MGIIESSKDILYLIIAFCVLWLTIFLSWLLYQIIVAIKQLNVVIKETRNKLQFLEGVLVLMKEKVESSSSYIAIIGEALKHGLSYLLAKRSPSEKTMRQRPPSRKPPQARKRKTQE